MQLSNKKTEVSTNVWIDHCDLSSNRDHDKDYYDGLIDVCDLNTLSPAPLSYKRHN